VPLLFYQFLEAQKEVLPYGLPHRHLPAFLLKKNKNNNQYNKFEMFIADNKSSLPATTQNNQ